MMTSLPDRLREKSATAVSEGRRTPEERDAAREAWVEDRIDALEAAALSQLEAAADAGERSAKIAWSLQHDERRRGKLTMALYEELYRRLSARGLQCIPETLTVDPAAYMETVPGVDGVPDTEVEVTTPGQWSGAIKVSW